ncbi:MAG: NADP-dependent phosphogluconate dehydrogenase, partial [Gammaproteobacteria bacterium]
GAVAMIWRGGCIIRSRFLGNIKAAFEAAPELENLLLDDFFADAVRAAEAGWRRTVMLGVELGIPMPAFSSALAFYDGYRSARLPANLIQAQRDYFGAHTYERLDAPRGERFHTDWVGLGGGVSSSSYEV